MVDRTSESKENTKCWVKKPRTKLGKNMGNKGPHVQTQIFFIFKYASIIDQCEYLKLT